MMRDHQAGLSLIEVLVAVVLIGLVLSSFVANTVRLTEANSRAEVQSLEANAVEGVARVAADTLPGVGSSVHGQVAVDVPSPDLTSDQRAIWLALSYTVQRQDDGHMRLSIQRDDLHPDPNPLIAEVQP